MGNDKIGIIKSEIQDTIDSLDQQIDEYSKSIFGYPETQDMDIMFEEYVEFLNKVRGKLESTLELIKS